MINEDMYMISNETTYYKANAVSQYHIGKLCRDKAFYDQIRSDFLKQSALYLRVSCTRNHAGQLGAE